MHQETSSEKVRFCPWAESYLQHESLQVAASAGRVMLKCEGSYIDRLLDEGQRRVGDGSFDKPFSELFKDLCFELMALLTPKPASDAQCERNFRFLREVVDNDRVSSEVRGLSLWNIYHQRRDRKTLELMEKYENHSDPEVSSRASAAADSLRDNYGLK